jgi:ribosomal protein S18
MRIKTLKRLIAEDGKILRNAETGVTAYCVDVLEEKVEKWEEIEDTEKDEVV